jgi:hypothetical protein
MKVTSMIISERLLRRMFTTEELDALERSGTSRLAYSNTWIMVQGLERYYWLSYRHVYTPIPYAERYRSVDNDIQGHIPIPDSELNENFDAIVETLKIMKLDAQQEICRQKQADLDATELEKQLMDKINSIEV